MSVLRCNWCGHEANYHQCTSDTCSCGRPPKATPESIVEVGVISEDLKERTYLGVFFSEPHYLTGTGNTLFDSKTKEPVRLSGATLHCDRDGKLYQYCSDLQ